MIVGYDVASYSYGTGPCIAPSEGYLKVDRFETVDREAAMRDILRRQLAQNPTWPRVTSVIVTFHWGEGERIQLRAGLLDRNRPERAPQQHQPQAMADFIANTWVGEDEPRVGVIGDR